MQYELTFIASKTGVEEERPIFAHTDLAAVQAAATKVSLLGGLGSNFKLTAPDGREIALPCIGRSRSCGQVLGRVMGDKIAEEVSRIVK